MDLGLNFSAKGVVGCLMIGCMHIISLIGVFVKWGGGGGKESRVFKLCLMGGTNLMVLLCFLEGVWGK